MSSLPQLQSMNDRVRQSVEAQREILMDILNEHFNDIPPKPKNKYENETRMERRKEKRRSTASKTTTTRGGASRATNASTMSQSTTKTATSRRSGSQVSVKESARGSVGGKREKDGHLRIVSQDSHTTIDIPPSPPSKSAGSKTKNAGKRSSQRHSSYTRSEVYPNHIRPVRPHQDTEAPYLHLPSCTGLPPVWNATHDRFIAYLATHAPLDRNGKVPKEDDIKERWAVQAIVSMVRRRFRGLSVVKATAIERRLQLLDESGDNDYFKKRYGAYRDMDWGRGI